MSTAAVAAPPLSGRAPLYRSLFVQVLVALVLGIVLGVAAPDFAYRSRSSATPSSS